MTSIIYGRNPVLEALRAGEPLEEIRVAQGAKTRGQLGEIARLARDTGVHLTWVPRSALDRMMAEAGPAAPGGGGNHQGVLALASDFAYHDVAEILAAAIRAGEPPLVLVLDQIQDVHNLGSLIRSAEAAGAHGVIIPERKAAGVTPAVRKASAGAVAHLPVARLDLVDALDQLREQGVRVAGLDEDGSVDYTGADLRGPLALVVGGEARGLTKAVARRCDALLRLPMRGRVESLNAAVAGSIVLYEALRQRVS